MHVTLYELYTNPIKRLHSRLSRKCDVELGTGRHITIENHIHMFTCELPYPHYSLSKEEEMDLIHAQMLMGL